MKRLAIVLVLLCFAIPLSLPTSTTADNGRELTIMHTGSFYNRILEFTPFGQPLQGGAARLAAQANDIRANQPNSLLVSSGSDVMGTNMFAQYGGVVSAEVMSQIGYDVALASQIDIAAGGNIDAFKAYNAVASYPLVNANMDLSNFDGISVEPYIVLEVNDLQVGVFGLANELGISLVNFAGAADVMDTDAVIADALAYFEAEEVDIVVLLSSLGISRDREVAEAYGGEIDIIVGNDFGGTLLGEPEHFTATNAQPAGPYPLVYGSEDAPTLVVYAGRFGSYLGELNVIFDDNGILTSWGGQLHFMGEDVIPDPDVQAYVSELAAGIILDQIVIGETTEALNGSFRDFPWQENALANLYADAFLEFGEPFGAQIAIVNAGAVWSSLPEGEISVAAINSVQPFFNWLIIMDITGEQLKTALEHGVAEFGGENRGPFLHVAGLSYTFDPEREAGDRVTEVLFDGEPIDPAGVYTIAVNDFMANGGDGYVVLRQGVNTLNTGLSITDLLLQYIQAHSPVSPPDLGRITVAN